jgi:16S rRNA (uracil1498-N3)-methyltransferase
MKRFFTTYIQSDNVLLSEEESHHCLQVLRAKDGEIIEIVNGKGDLWEAQLNITSKKHFNIQIIQQKATQEVNTAKCSMAVSLTKNIDRIEWLVEKATEIGLVNFYPIITHRTERKQVRLDRLEKIVVSAMKQSERLWKPEIFEPILFEKFLNLPLENNRYFGHCESHLSKYLLSEIYKNNHPGLILIGPEGDFTEDEIKMAIDHKFQAVSIGTARLRVETAAIAAFSWMNLK